MNPFVDLLTRLNATHVAVFLVFIVVVAVLLKISKSFVRWHRKKEDEGIVSYKDPDNLPDLSRNIWKIRIQIILAAFSIITFTTIAIINSF